jgi:hypothetical protein
MSKFKFLVAPASIFLLLTFSLAAPRSAASCQQDDLVGTEFFFATDVTFDPDYPGGQPPKIIFLGQEEPGAQLCDLPETFWSKTVVAPGNVPALQGNRARFVYILHEQIYPVGTEATFLGLVDNCGVFNVYKAVITNVPQSGSAE